MAIEPEDLEIVELARAGGRGEAMTRFHARHGSRLAAACRRLARRPDDADDALQQVLVQVDRSLADFRGEADLYTWAFRIAVHVCLNLDRGLRARTPHVALEDAEEQPGGRPARRRRPRRRLRDQLPGPAGRTGAALAAGGTAARAHPARPRGDDRRRDRRAARHRRRTRSSSASTGRAKGCASASRGSSRRAAWRSTGWARSAASPACSRRPRRRPTSRSRAREADAPPVPDRGRARLSAMTAAPSAAAAERDREFTRLVDAEGARLLAFGRRFCGDGSDAEDLVQETFTQAFALFRPARPTRRDARAWLYTIARHACQRMHRRRCRRAGAPGVARRAAAAPGRDAARVLGRAGDPLGDRLRDEAREIVERAITAAAGALPADARPRRPRRAHDRRGRERARPQGGDGQDPPPPRPAEAAPGARRRGCRSARPARRRTAARSASTCWRPSSRPWTAAPSSPTPTPPCASAAAPCSRLSISPAPPALRSGAAASRPGYATASSRPPVSADPAGVGGNSSGPPCLSLDEAALRGATRTERRRTP